jgi:hypothetical protein
LKIKPQFSSYQWQILTICVCFSESECRKAARGVARMIQRGMGKKDDPVRMRNYRVCNIMATCKLPFGIKIEEVRSSNNAHAFCNN